MKLTSIKTFFLLLFLTSITTALSQTTAIDSLKIGLQKHTGKDTLRVNILNDLAYEYYRMDPNKAMTYLNESKAIAESINFIKGKGRSLYMSGIVLSAQSSYDKALLSFNEALRLYQKINYKVGIAHCYSGIGIVFNNRGDYKKSITYHKKSMNISKERGVNVSSGDLINLGNAYSALGEYDEAIIYLKKALAINRDSKNYNRESSCLNSIGIIYQEQGNYPLAIENYNKALFINKKYGITIGIAQVLNNLGVVHKHLENYDKAIKYYEESLKLSKKLNSKKGVSILLSNIGDIYKEKKDLDAALNYYNEALEISKAIGYKSQVSLCLINIGKVYLKLKDNNNAHISFEEAKTLCIAKEDNRNLCVSYLGIAKAYTDQKKYNKALINVLKSQKIANKLGAKNHQRDIYNLLSIIYENTGNYKKALESHQRFKILNDSLFNKKNIEKITQLEYEYRYKQVLDSAKIKELQLTKTVRTTSQNLEKSQRNLLLGVIVFLTIALLMGAVIFAQKLRNVQTRTQNIIVEQKLLRSQMTPHFIFNSLSVLQGMILNKEEKTSVLYLSKFSKLLRTILENSRHKMVALSEELSAINSYMALQNLDVNPPFNYTLIVGPKIDRYTLKIPPMLIQPFIENAIEHAFPSKKENKEIIVALTFEDKKLICTITDNGIGIDEDKQRTKKNKHSLATTITSERLDMLSKEFNTEGSISVKNRKEFGDEGTLVTLIIPYKKATI